MTLENRVALITGAGRGIGRAIAGAFAAEGAKLALAARTRAELDETARMVENAGAETLVVLADVTDESDVKSMVEQTLAPSKPSIFWSTAAGIAGPVGPVKPTTCPSGSAPCRST